jgi:hypothetical protein
MPKNQVNNATASSIAELCKKIENIKNINEKIDFATEFLLQFHGNEDATIDQAINVARMKILDSVEQYKELEEINERKKLSKEAFPDEEIEEIDLKEYGGIHNNDKLDYFLSNPISYLKLSAKKIENPIIGKKLNQNDYAINVKRLDSLNLKVDKKQLNHLHINSRLKEKFGGLKELNKAVKNTKQTFFQKLFRKISPEGQYFLDSYKKFNDPNSSLYGNKENLAKAANVYMEHIFPNWKPGYPLPDIHMINSLSGTQKSRTILCYGIIESIRKENKIEAEYEDATNENNIINPNAVFNDNKVIRQTIANLDQDLKESASYDNEIENENNIIENKNIEI